MVKFNGTQSKALEGVGVIIPPPDLRSILDTTASFVAKKPAFESRILQKNGDDPRFAFLHSSNPYHAYYRERIQHHREVKEAAGAQSEKKDDSRPEKAKSTEPDSVDERSEEQQHAARSEASRATTVKTAVVSFLKAERAKQQAERPEPREPPADDLFTLVSVNPPPHPLALDVMKLTAQFVAQNGTQFLSVLSQKESRNSIFDFLKPMHPHNIVFQRLLDAYKAILDTGEQKQQLLKSLRKQAESKENVLKEVWYKHDWECQKAEREYEAALNENEKMKGAQIDWYDFVVVETVDFGEDDVDLPAPIADTRQLPKILAAARKAEQERIKNQREVDMEIDTVGETANKVRVDTANVDNDIPASRIRRDEPKQRRESEASVKEATVVLPSGARVPMSKVQESIRTELMNPSYKSERARAADKNRIQNLADGDEVARNLARWGQVQRKGVVYNRGDLQKALAVMPKGKVTEADASVRKAERLGPKLPGRGVAEGEDNRATKKARVEAAVDVLSRAKQQVEATEIDAEVGSGQGAAVGAAAGGSGLMSAEEWLKKQGSNAQVRIKLPMHGNKEWELEGQEIEMSAPLKRSVGKLKNAIAKFTKLPANKQKLSMVGVGFLKDSTSLAAYNVGDGAVISVEVKERGGRKKHG